VGCCGGGEGRSIDDARNLLSVLPCTGVPWRRDHKMGGRKASLDINLSEPKQ